MASKEEVRARLRAHMERLGISRDNERNDLPVGPVYAEAVPIRGSVHLAQGLTVSHKEIDRQFRTLRFR